MSVNTADCPNVTFNGCRRKYDLINNFYSRGKFLYPIAPTNTNAHLVYYSNNGHAVFRGEDGAV